MQTKLTLRIDMQLMKNGEHVTAWREARKVPANGDVVFMQDEQANKLQVRVVMYGAPWVITRVQGLYETIDRSASVDNRNNTECDYQINLQSYPLFRVSRNYLPLLNLATAENVNGNVGSLTTGPDDREYSAVSFESPNLGMSDTLEASLEGDFSLTGYFKGFSSVGRLFQCGNLVVEIRYLGGDYFLYVSDGVNPIINEQIQLSPTQWNFFAILLMLKNAAIHKGSTRSVAAIPG